ncbi:MAG: WG repeat-containing protein, partial [Crocosphaera sp.]|uniref:WG repeat-containing protein n=1 Tax=Crocosphaera sp. TaxID=2729996 RepID=UPI00258D2A3B
IELELREVDLVTEINNDEGEKYRLNIFSELDSVSSTKIFTIISCKIVDFKPILDNYKNLEQKELCQQIYQQTVKSFQDEPDKLEIILADFYKLTQEPIFKSNTNILTTAQTIFIESNLQKNSNNLETKIELTSSFPEPITAIFIATDQVNTDTELNFITSEDSLRSISKEDIATYQNQLLQEFFSETIEANQVLLLANCLKFTVQKSENNQYSGILATNDENHQINYQLTPVQQNQYNLELESPQLNWKHDYQINLDNPNHINFLHRLDSDLVEFILSLTDEETVLKKAITLTPHPEAENYNSGYLTTPNGNNRINYQIQVNSENNQNQFELSANKKTWTYQLDTSNLANRTFLQHVNPSLAVALEIQEALRVLANDDKIQSVLIRRQKNNDDDAISVYSKDKTTTELTVLIPSSSTDSSLQSVLSASQEIRIEQTYINDLLRYKLSFPNDDEDAKAIKITQIIDSTGKIQVQTTEEHPVKVFSDTGIITHHSDRISSETIEVEYNDYLEDATFTYHAAGQLIISNLIEGMKVEHYIKPPIQNIVNGVDESFILLKPEDKIIFIEVESKSLDGFTTKLISNYQINTDSSLQNSEIDSEPIPFYFKSKYGYVKNGKVVIPFEFDYAAIFEDGVAQVVKNGRVGYIDTTGKIVIPFEVENNSLKRFREGLAAVKKDGKWGYINKIGKLVIPYQFDEAKEFSEGLAQVSYHEKEDGKTTYIHDVGYINKKGEVIIPFEFSYGQYFSNGLAPVQQYNQELGGYKYGYINKTGRWVIPCQFDFAQPFHNGFAEVTINRSFKQCVGAINAQGEFIVYPQDNISGIYTSNPDLIKVRSYIIDETRPTGKSISTYSVIDKKTQRTVLSSLEEIVDVHPRKKQPFFAKKNNKWACFDTSGEMIADFQFDDVKGFSEGLGGIKQDDKWGYINERGEISIALQFDDVNGFSEGLAFVIKGDKCGCINKIGQLVIPYEFDKECYQFNEFGMVYFTNLYQFQEGFAKVLVNDKKYLIDTNKTVWVSESDYDKITIQMP